MKTKIKSLLEKLEIFLLNFGESSITWVYSMIGIIVIGIFVPTIFTVIGAGAMLYQTLKVYSELD